MDRGQGNGGSEGGLQGVKGGNARILAAQMGGFEGWTSNGSNGL